MDGSSRLQRRLILGLGLAAVAGGLALVPLDLLTPTPSKPLFFYLTPLVRVQVTLPPDVWCLSVHRMEGQSQQRRARIVRVRQTGPALVPYCHCDTAGKCLRALCRRC